MDYSDIEAEDLPDSLPVFPLSGVVLLPGGDLPLNVFEPRYLAMVDDALKTDQRLIGVIQPLVSDDLSFIERDILTPQDDVPLYKTGAAGRIISFSETSDGRYLITLKGVRRFNIIDELELRNGYRRVKSDWSPFEEDGNELETLDLDRGEMKQLLARYFDKNDLSCDWDIIDDTPDERLITCLSMICPFNAQEKQALLEAEDGLARAKKFMTILRMSLYADTSQNGCH